MRVLALDFGRARTGAAMSDAGGALARPLGVIERANSSDGLASIAQMVAAEGAERIVVGLPVGLDGRETAQTARARSFADRLRKQVEVPVELHDERFTSRMADAVVRETGSSTARDSLAACHILESYLEAHAT